MSARGYHERGQARRPGRNEWGQFDGSRPNPYTEGVDTEIREYCQMPGGAVVERKRATAKERRIAELRRNIESTNGVIGFNVGHNREAVAEIFRKHVAAFQAELDALTGGKG